MLPSLGIVALYIAAVPRRRSGISSVPIGKPSIVDDCVPDPVAFRLLSSCGILYGAVPVPNRFPVATNSAGRTTWVGRRLDQTAERNVRNFAPAI